MESILSNSKRLTVRVSDGIMAIKKFKKGEAMQKDGDDCFTCRKTNCIQVSVNGEGYWCRFCGYGGTMSYAVDDS